MPDWLDMLPKEVQFITMAALAIYIVVNPSGVSSVFLGLTKGATAAERRSIAFRAAIGGGLILALFALGGAYLFRIFRVTGAALQIAGGIFVFGVAFALARGKEDEFFGTAATVEGEPTSRTIAWSPLAVPLIAGPASITVVMTLSADATTNLARAGLLAAIATVALLCLLSMLRFIKLAEKKGSGIDFVLPRIMGLVLAVIAVQFLIEGIAQVLPQFAAAIRDAAPPR